MEASRGDVETNTRQTKVFQVSPAGRAKPDRPLQTRVKSMRWSLIRVRVVCVTASWSHPRRRYRGGLDQADKTLTTKVEITPERIAKMVETFEAMGVSKEALRKKIGRNVDHTIPPAVFSNPERLPIASATGTAQPPRTPDLVSDAAIEAGEKLTNRKQEQLLTN